MTQAEADALLAATKWFDDSVTIDWAPGTSMTYDLESSEPESFMLDASRSSIRLSKASLNHRVRSITILARLDLDGPPHMNPDGEKIDSPHLHVYREGFDDRWAYPLGGFPFSNPRDLVTSFLEFCDFCHIRRPRDVQDSLL